MYLMGNDIHEEVIEVEDIKELSDRDQMEKIADKFAAVSNLYEPLRRDKIDFPTTRGGRGRNGRGGCRGSRNSNLATSRGRGRRSVRSDRGLRGSANSE